MAILGNDKNNYDTETTTANNSMGFDPSAIQSCCFLLYIDRLRLPANYFITNGRHLANA